MKSLPCAGALNGSNPYRYCDSPVMQISPSSSSLINLCSVRAESAKDFIFPGCASSREIWRGLLWWMDLSISDGIADASLICGSREHYFLA